MRSSHEARLIPCSLCKTQKDFTMIEAKGFGMVITATGLGF